MILTGKQIVDLAQLAGLIVDREMLDGEELETKFTIAEYDGTVYAFYTEYPEEGGIELGEGGIMEFINHDGRDNEESFPASTIDKWICRQSYLLEDLCESQKLVNWLGGTPFSAGCVKGRFEAALDMLDSLIEALEE